VAGIKDISTVWKNIKEIDLKPIRDSATYPIRIAVVGAQGAGKHTLAEQMRTDPARPGVHTQSAMALITREAATEPPDAHLIIVLVDATSADFSDDQLLVKKWSEGGKNVLVFINKIDLVNNSIAGDIQQGWLASRVIYGSVNDGVYLQREFIPTVLDLLPQQQIALGRQFPLFRLPIARLLINETCLSNAAYSFSTGLAEIVPVLDLPLNVTDLVVLTKSQAFLAYKLGLLLGFSTRWQDYVTEFGSVIGSGFVWRQIARSLIGLIPAWGIIPKVAVAYSGTYVVGNAILGWYLTGRKLSPKQMRALSVQAFTRGKEYARKLGQTIPRPRLGIRKKDRLPAPQKKPALPEEIVISKKNSLPQADSSAEGTDNLVPAANDRSEALSNDALVADKVKAERSRPEKRIHINRRKQIEASNLTNPRTCSQCGKISSADARFCQYCGAPFER
jgi:signal recognition particle receptor subunit beta/uncharacterized protein (DUF697 family)